MLIIFKLGMCEDLKKALVQLSANVLFSFSFFLSFFWPLTGRRSLKVIPHTHRQVHTDTNAYQLTFLWGRVKHLNVSAFNTFTI